MVVLGSEIRLLSIGDSTLIGLTRGTTDDEILITTNNSVILYEVSSQRPLTSWSTSFNQLLQIPAIYDSFNKCFLTVINGNIVRKWTAAGDHVESGSKITLSSPVVTVCGLVDPDAVILVYENGRIEFLNDSLVEFSLKLDSHHQIHLVKALQCYEKIHLAIISSGQNVMDAICHHVILCSGGVLHSYNILHLPKSSVPKTIQLRATPTNEIEAAILWPDDSLNVGILKSKDNEMTLRTAFSLHETNNEKIADMIFLKNNIAYACLNDSSEPTCCLYNLKFKALTVKKVLKTSAPVSQVHMYNVNDKVFIVLGNEILLLPYVEEVSNLSKVIGIRRKENTNRTLGFDTPLMWTTDGLKKNETTSGNVDGDLKQDFSKNFLDKVNILESRGTAERTACVEVFQEILEKKDFDLLLDALKYYRDIPEAILVNALHCFLSTTVAKDCLKNEQVSKDSQCADVKYPVIDQIISIKLNDVFMLDHLRKLSLDEVLVMLKYLQNLLKHHTYQNESVSMDIARIVDWISMLLDAHFHQLIVTKNEEVYTFLDKLHSLVNLQWKCLEEFVALQETVSFLLSQEKLCHNLPQSDYSIEILKFE